MIWQRPSSGELCMSLATFQAAPFVEVCSLLGLTTGPGPKIVGGRPEEVRRS
jgi:hypothetical protein